MDGTVEDSTAIDTASTADTYEVDSGTMTDSAVTKPETAVGTASGTLIAPGGELCLVTDRDDGVVERGLMTDGSRALFLSAFASKGFLEPGSTGTLEVAVLPSGAPTVLASKAGIAYRAATGTKVVYYDAIDDLAAVTDIHAIDAVTGVGSVVATRARLSKNALPLGLDSTKTKIVYSTRSVALPGVYLADVP